MGETPALEGDPGAGEQSPNDQSSGEQGRGARACQVDRPSDGSSCGFHLSRTQWDPYPWVSGVDAGSAAAAAGLRPGDCVLEVNGEDVLGERIGAVAQRVRAKPDRVDFLLWNSGSDPKCTPESLCCGPMPVSLQRLSRCVAAIVAALECPVCLEPAAPPTHQCAHGHLLCSRCRLRADRCPVCRLRLTRGRSLLADHCFQALADAFNLKAEAEEARPAKLRERLFGHRRGDKPPRSKPSPPTNKFLARLMGRASSVENLSSVGRKGARRAEEEEEEVGGCLKAKSLSTSEIFRPRSPAASPAPTRSPSTLLLAPRVNGLAGDRPASYHGSCESLGGRLAADFGDEGLLSCPLRRRCDALLRGPAALLEHAGAAHGGGGPLLVFGGSEARLALPSPPPAALAAALRCPPGPAGLLFFVSAEPLGDDDSDDEEDGDDGESETASLNGDEGEDCGWRVRVFAAGTAAEAEGFSATASLRAGALEVRRAVPVAPLAAPDAAPAPAPALRFSAPTLRRLFPAAPRRSLELRVEVTETPAPPPAPPPPTLPLAQDTAL